MATSSSAFPETPRFEAFCRHLNSFSVDLFSVALARIISCCCSGRKAFSDAEFDELVAIVGLSPTDATELIEGCLFVFERAASTGLKPMQLLEALTAHGVSEPQATLISRSWATGSAELLSTQRGILLGAPGVLASSSFSLTLGAGSSAETSTKTARAIIALQVIDGCNDGVTATSEQQLRVELDRAQLTSLLAQLDKAQQQIDSLS